VLSLEQVDDVATLTHHLRPNPTQGEA